ncbi:hypothetical protein EVAR_78289_1 [Eumeta japonica]|uniref:Uncharacterized protein n=1 Tax=Eumeta variegata TaxID=151549 RepID=A0A4C1T5P9_EUMVA|nr:hypothetical protein EVAR_78289_1 [Eumeta japonica]
MHAAAARRPPPAGLGTRSRLRYDFIDAIVNLSKTYRKLSFMSAKICISTLSKTWIVIHPMRERRRKILSSCIHLNSFRSVNDKSVRATTKISGRGRAAIGGIGRDVSTIHARDKSSTPNSTTRKS